MIMKLRKFIIPLAAVALAGCSFLKVSDSTTATVDSSLETTSSGAVSHSGSASDYALSISSPTSISVTETSADFEISSDDGSFSSSGNVYTLTDEGTYTLSGKLTGQIVVNAGDDDDVEIVLNGVSLSYGLDSPIKVLNANKVEISASKDTGNIINDTRAHKSVENDDQGEGAISAKADLKLKGKGILVVSSNYNNAVHTTKDLVVKNLTLKATGYNNALKGKNSVTIESGVVQAYAQTGSGIKTDNSDLSSNGNQRGTIAIQGGSVYVDSLRDGIDASYNVEISEAESDVSTSVSILTGKESSFYTSSFKADSEKGLKSQNDIIISAGTVIISASDDGIHANYGETLGNSEKGTGNVTISGGIIKVISGDDGIHADNTLTISGGVVIVAEASEGIEANYVVISGGDTYVYGTDDGVNASKKSFSNCSFTMNGGYLDVTVSSGDTDGIDTNGDFTLTDGIIVTRGGPGNAGGMSTGLDADGTCKMTGGTLISFNGLEKAPTISSGILYAGTSQANASNGMGGGKDGMHKEHSLASSSSGTFEAGSYKLSGSNVDIEFVNTYSYSKFCVYSSSFASSQTYSLSKGGSVLKSWTQSSSSVTIS